MPRGVFNSNERAPEKKETLYREELLLRSDAAVMTDVFPPCGIMGRYIAPRGRYTLFDCTLVVSQR